MDRKRIYMSTVEREDLISKNLACEQAFGRAGN